MDTKLFDHTILKADAGREAVKKICDEAKEYGFMSVCVNSYYTSYVAQQLKGTDVKVCTVIGFPLGQMSTRAKVAETAIAVEDGLKEALSCRKWAYAADFIRLYAVYHEGGIYLDTDVMVYKSLDSYLKDRAFIGKETSIHFTGRMSSQYLSSHCFGAEAHHPYIKQCLDYYSNRHFITSNIESLPNPLRLNIVILPYIQAEIARLIGYDWKPLHQDVQHLKDGLVIYPSHIFDPIEQNVQSVCRHLALGSWRDEKSSNQTCSIWYKFEWRIIKLLQKILDKFNYKIVKIQ